MGVVKVTAVRRRVAGKKSAQPNDSEANIAFIRLVVMMYVRFPLSHAAKELDKALIVNPHGIVANEPAISEAQSSAHASARR